MKRLNFAILAIVLTGLVISGCSKDVTDWVSFYANQYTKVDLPGAVCGDGSQYKFFYKKSTTSSNIVFIFEPGGACWDYDSCKGNLRLKPANRNGIADNHLTLTGGFEDPNGIIAFHSPFMW